jgi:localization factor PodJL
MKNKAKQSSTKIPSWQVKGVTFETREAVKIAARKSGMTMGEWVNETLHKSATETITGQSTLPAHRVEDQLASISDKLDAMQKPFWSRLFIRR